MLIPDFWLAIAMKQITSKCSGLKQHFISSCGFHGEEFGCVGREVLVGFLRPLQHMGLDWAHGASGATWLHLVVHVPFPPGLRQASSQRGGS